jgi:hypothetical protein
MYILRQTSIASGFAYEIFNTYDQCIGKLEWPAFPQAKNARMMLHKPGSSAGNIKVEYNGSSGEISYEFLTRDWANDVRFFYKEGDTLLATADVIKLPKFFSRHKINIIQPFEATVTSLGWFGAHYEVKTNNEVLGAIRESSGFRFKRELRVDLPDSIAPAIQFFLFFLVCNHAYR